MGSVQLCHGGVRYQYYDTLSQRFWQTLWQEAGETSDESVSTAKSASTLDLFLSHGFTGRLGNMPEPVPIRDDDSGAHDLRRLDGWLPRTDTGSSADTDCQC